MSLETTTATTTETTVDSKSQSSQVVKIQKAIASPASTSSDLPAPDSDTSIAITTANSKETVRIESCAAGGAICCGSSCKHECCGVITRDRKGVFHESAGRIDEALVLERATELEFVLKVQKFGECTMDAMCAASWTLMSNEDIIHTADSDSRYAGQFVIPTQPGDKLIFSAAACSPRAQHIRPLVQSPVSVFVGFRPLRRGS
jgi:hypothetical protein